MKSTGIIRKIDELGRLVFPIEIRKVLSIEEGDRIEIYVIDNKIVCKKHSESPMDFNTSVLRPVDSLGRIVIPMEVRKLLSLPQKARMQIFIDGDAIVLKHHQEQCVFCLSDEGLVAFKDKKVCSACREQLAKLQ